MKHINAMETGLNLLGVAIGVTDINNWINLFLLIVSILALIARSTIKIVEYLQNKQYDKASDEAQRLHDELTKKEDSKNE